MTTFWDSLTDHPTIQEFTDENMEALRQAQFAFTARYLTECHDSYSDDDIDYLPTALQLASVLMFATYDSPGFTLLQLRIHVANVCLDGVSCDVLTWLYDDYDHYQSFDLDNYEHMMANWDYENPHTIDTNALPTT